VRKVLATVALLMLVACGSSTSAASGPADVAVRSGDLPKALVRCDGSGDINTFLNSVKTKDPATYQSTKSDWDDAKKNGATSAVVVFEADTKDHCTSIQNSNSNDFGSATYPFVINFVIQFKDEATAQKGYTTESIFGFSQSTLSQSGGSGVITGTATGLTTNSIALSVAIASQSFYVAVWQNKTYMVILGVLNIDLGQAKKIATTLNGRIT
jgi:hypothetical protein